METQPTQRIFVTGGSGFVGTAVIEELAARGFAVTALVHRGELKAAANANVCVARGDLFNASALDQAMAGCDAIIHLVGIIREDPGRGVAFERVHFQGAKNVMDAARRVGIRRFLLMSALGAGPGAASHYHQTKFQAERTLRNSNLDWTVFQPSLIHGPGGEFLKMEAAWARGKKPPFLFMPYFGAGLLGLGAKTTVQPVYVKDVARAFADAIDNPKTIGQIYPVCGSQVLTWPQMHHIAALLFTGLRRPTIAIPTWYANLLTHIVPAKLLPFTRDQVIMAQEDNSADMSKFRADFGWEPGPFDQTLQSYAAEME